MVRTFVCPKDVGLPSCIGDKGVDADESHDGKVSLSKKLVSPSSKHIHKFIPVSDCKERKQEVKQLMDDIKQLSSQTFSGLKKKKHHDDALTCLGVNAPKQQKMPLKMALGIRDGRKKRMIKQIERSRESGVVLDKSLSYKAINESSASSVGNKKRSRTAKNERQGGLDINTKQGVLRLKKSRLSAGLV